MIMETTGWCGWCEVVEDCNVDVSAIELFNPDNSQQPRNVPKDVLIAYNRRLGVRHIRYFAGPYRLQKDESSVIIQIDGACRRNGSQYARGDWGVFFGPGSQNNTWGLLPPGAPQTSTFAELYSLMMALDMIRDELPLYPETVFIVSDSSYLLTHRSTEMSAAVDCPECESPPTEAEDFGEEQEDEKEYEERERRFDPAAYPQLRDIPNEGLIQFDPETQRSNLTHKCLETGETKVDPTTIIIHLANGHNQVADSWALYFGPQSSYNKSYVMPWLELISEEKAGYKNLEEALHHIYDSLSAMIEQVIIATDSPSLFKLVTEDIPKMARDRGFREGGKENSDVFHDIWKHLNADQPEPYHDGPLDFRFWLVSKEMNQEAQAMAQCLIDREMQKIHAEPAGNPQVKRRRRFRRRRLYY
ncbi:NAD dependent epimerase [Fusarium agapanthi]|uniref:NAD dependent epimerase n=1 Tax=Fusarium agapanthi TaxID=1803897 RepID=A0A9P5B2J1_9HYPO|nr:NAD dependent epimerase [Fusarium agapanthi]